MEWRNLVSSYVILCIVFIIGLETNQITSEETFPYDINPGPLPLPALLDIKREKRAVCGLSKGLFTRWEKIKLRQVHNTLRRNMKTPGTNIQRLDWKIELAQRAQYLADQCIYEHNELFDCDNARMGQNLYVTWGHTKFPTLNVTAVVEAWHNEIDYYDMETNSCTAVCGHYTQVVWAKSTHFGCGVSYCETLKHPGAADKLFAIYVVCDYSPAGNYAGRRPYNTGTPCSECPTTTTCQNNLCIPN